MSPAGTVNLYLMLAQQLLELEVGVAYSARAQLNIIEYFFGEVNDYCCGTTPFEK